jgi:hemerythrin superfamily protein
MRNSILYETLSRDHEKIADVFSRLAGSQKEETRLRRVFDLQNTLTPHILAEDREVLSHIEAVEGEAAPAQIRHEHDELRGELEKISRIPVNDESFGRQVDLLYNFWQRHVEAEERTLRAALDRIASEAAAGILRNYKSERDRHTRSGPEAARNWL